MTEKKNLKKLARERSARTGEKYQEALRQILLKLDLPPIVESLNAGEPPTHRKEFLAVCTGLLAKDAFSVRRREHLVYVNREDMGTDRSDTFGDVATARIRSIFLDSYAPANLPRICINRVSVAPLNEDNIAKRAARHFGVERTSRLFAYGMQVLHGVEITCAPDELLGLADWAVECASLTEESARKFPSTVERHPLTNADLTYIWTAKAHEIHTNAVKVGRALDHSRVQ